MYGRTAGASWYKNLNRVFVTLSLSKTGISDTDPKFRRKVRKKAREISDKCKFPLWDCEKAEMDRLRIAPDLCLVIGIVKPDQVIDV